MCCKFGFAAYVAFLILVWVGFCVDWFGVAELWFDSVSWWLLYC